MLDLSDAYSTAFFWTWFLIWMRFLGVFTSLLGIGTEQVPPPFRLVLTIILSLVVTLAVGAHAPEPAHALQGGLMIGLEFLLGYLLGVLPTLMLSGVSVAGQVVTGAIGLSQAHMIDPSLGESVTIFARLKMLIAVLVFLAINGHHAVIRAAADAGQGFPPGSFHPSGELAMFLVDRFKDTFELALSISAPVLVMALVTQFLFGLITRAVPQVNIFIMSMPLTIGLGLFIIAYTFPGLEAQVESTLSSLEEHLAFVNSPPSP